MGELDDRDLARVARANSLGDWQFCERLHGRTLALRGMPRQSWNAAAYLMAHHAVTTGKPVCGALPASSRDGQGTIRL